MMVPMSLPARRLNLPTEVVAEVVAVVAAEAIGTALVVVVAVVVAAADDVNTTVAALQERPTRKRKSTNRGVVMKARRNSRLRPLLQTMLPLNKLLPLRVGNPAEVVTTGHPAGVAVMTGLLEVVTLTGPPLPLPPPQTPKSPPSGLTVVPRIAKRKNKTIH